jgi:hypothetical protein
MDRLLMYRKMHALLKEVGIESSKSALLEGYGVEHTNALSDAELKHLVDRLAQMKEAKMDYGDAEKKHWRSNVLTLCNKYGVYVTNDNWTDVNKLLLQKRVAGKLLYEMSKEELQAACLRLRSILSKRQKVQDHEKQLTLKN